MHGKLLALANEQPTDINKYASWEINLLQHLRPCPEWIGGMLPPILDDVIEDNIVHTHERDR